MDNTDPNTTKTYGSPHYYDESSDKMWICPLTPIYLNVTDTSGCDENPINISYRIWNQSHTWTDWNTVQTDGEDNSIIVYVKKDEEECTHYIEYYATDAHGNKEQTHNQTFYVDSTVPTSTKTIGQPVYPWLPMDPEYGKWVTTQTLMILTGTDAQGACGHHMWRIHWEIWLTTAGETKLVDQGVGDWNTSVTINFTEECKHTLVWWAEDRAGNKEPKHHQIHFVDTTPPESWKIIGDPSFDTDLDGINETVATQTPLTLTANDGLGESAVYNWRIWYKVNNGTWSDWESGTWNTNVTLYFADYFSSEGVYELEWYAEDNLGNEENHHTQTHEVTLPE